MRSRSRHSSARGTGHMQLTRFTDLGLRVLMYLAVRRGEATTTVQQVGNFFQVSHNHLTKVVHRLAQVGWISTVQGRGGGISLALPEAQIRIGDVIASLEPTLEVIDCGAPPCPLAGCCRLKDVLGAAERSFLATLNEYTLSDLARGRTAKVIRMMPRIKRGG